MKKKGKSRYVEEVESSAALTVAGLVAAHLLGNQFYEDMKTGIRHTRHAGRTGVEMIVGSEGERAVDRLLDEQTTATREHYAEQLVLIDQLQGTYKANEEISRQIERLGVQLKGALANYTAAGDAAANKVTGGLFSKIDNAIMDLVGNSKDARENLPKLQDIYDQALTFYDGREKFEGTVHDLMDVLSERGLEAAKENEGIQNDLHSMTQQLDRTYQVEDDVFAIDDRVSFLKGLIGEKQKPVSNAEIRGLEHTVNTYGGNVDELRASVEQNAGVAPYQEPLQWLDYGVNPITFGIAAGLAAKGLTKLLPGLVETPLRKALAWPVHLVPRAIKKGVDGISYVGNKVVGAYRGQTKELKETEGSE